jgi:hypothetical protein
LQSITISVQSSSSSIYSQSEADLSWRHYRES